MTLKQDTLTHLFDKCAFPLACAGAFLLELKLALSYACLIPLITLWLLKSRPELPQVLRQSRAVTAPFLFFAASLIVSSFFGLNPWRSLRAVPALLFFPCAVLVYREIGLAGQPEQKKRPLQILFCLLTGQAVSALYTVLEGSLSGKLPRMFLGRVSESGQIAMTLLIGGGLLIFYQLQRHASSRLEAGASSVLKLPNLRSALLWGVLNSILFCAAAFAGHLPLLSAFHRPLLMAAACSLCFCLALSSAYFKHSVNEDQSAAAFQFLLGSIILPLLAGALLINLKRGPWAGVFIGGSILLFFYGRRLLIPLLALTILLVTLVTPIRDRLAQSSRDFFMTGGRSVIWEIGLELSTRYPLGVGFRNSPILQKYSLEIPPEMRHFHNNLINILVETGWLGLGLYLWWIFSTLKFCFQTPPQTKARPLIVAIGCAILSWQCAGMVEYNFGDSEVLMVAYILLGVLLSLSATGRNEYPNQP